MGLIAHSKATVVHADSWDLQGCPSHVRDMSMPGYAAISDAGCAPKRTKSPAMISMSETKPLSCHQEMATNLTRPARPTALPKKLREAPYRH